MLPIASSQFINESEDERRGQESDNGKMLTIGESREKVNERSLFFFLPEDLKFFKIKIGKIKFRFVYQEIVESRIQANSA